MLRRLLLALSLLLPAEAFAQQATVQGLANTSPPSGFTQQPLRYNCTSTTYCWPLSQLYDGTTVVGINAGDNGLLVHMATNPTIANTAFGVSGTLPAFASTPTFALNATPSLANGNGVVPTIGGAVYSATNGAYFNLLQGNAVNASGNPIFTQNTAGAAIMGKVGIDQTTPGTTNGVLGKVWDGTTTATVNSGDSGLTVHVANTLTGVGNNADAIAVTAAPNAGSPVIDYLFGFNGTTWDRLQVDGSKFLKVNCSAGCSSSASITSWGGGTLGAMANFGTTPGAVLVPGENASLFIGTVAAAAGHGTAAAGLRVELPTDGTGVVGLNAGTQLIGKAGIDQTTLGSTNGVSPVATTTGGGSQTGNIAANNTTAVVVKASAGTLYSLQLSGIGSAPAYLKIYNAASATCGSGTPVGRYMIPAAATAANGAGSNIDLGPVGVAYGTGITYCVTTGITDADTTAPAASTFLVNLVWK